MKTLSEVLEKSLTGLYYGNRVLLPFSAEILKIVFDDELITDFSSQSRNVQITLRENYTEIYFFKYKNIEESVTKYENIKLILVEKGKDIFDYQNHIKIALYTEANHKLKIEKLGDDILFIE
ncbi:MAG: hypothetical protein R6W90_05930 [Ignavibacteriaceae bacterium]